jgi:predicted protein tyrosine phosphatase
MKKETMAEYLARGGIVQKVEPTILPEAIHTLKSSGTPENRILSLDDGAFYFAENRKQVKVVQKILLNDVVDNYDLPKEVVDRLRGDNV